MGLELYARSASAVEKGRVLSNFSKQDRGKAR